KPRLGGSVAALSPVALEAAAHHVVPGAAPPERTWDHVVEIELRTRIAHSAILTRKVVACIDVDAAEAHMALGNAVKGNQHDDPGYADRTTRCPDRLRVACHRELAPALEIEGLVLPIDRARDALVDQGERPPHRCHVNRQIGAIQ